MSQLVQGTLSVDGESSKLTTLSKVLGVVSSKADEANT